MMSVGTTKISETFGPISTGAACVVAGMKTYDAGQIVVFVDGDETDPAVVNVDYTVAIAGDFSGVTVTPLAPLTARATSIVVARRTPLTSDFVIAPNGKVSEPRLVEQLDRTLMRGQENAETFARAIRFPVGDAAGSVLPVVSERANKLLAFDAEGGLATAASFGDVTVVTATQAEAEAGTNNTKMMTPLRVKQSVVGELAGKLSSEDGAVATQNLADSAVTAAKESDDASAPVASAATVDIGAVNSRNILITGSVTITSFGNTGAEGRRRLLRFSGAPILTHNAATLILPGGANITAAAGDTAEVVKEAGASAWRVVDYQRANGQAVVASSLRFFESGQVAYTAGASVIIAHGLGSTPKFIQVDLECVTAEHGYSVGQRVVFGGGIDDNTSANGVAVSVDATNINLRFGAALMAVLLRWTDGARVGVTPANWRYRIKAMA